MQCPCSGHVTNCQALIKQCVFNVNYTLDARLTLQPDSAGTGISSLARSNRELNDACGGLSLILLLKLKKPLSSRVPCNYKVQVIVWLFPLLLGKWINKCFRDPPWPCPCLSPKDRIILCNTLCVSTFLEASSPLNVVGLCYFNSS